MRPRRADETEALAITPDMRIDAGAERRVALVRRVDPTPTSLLHLHAQEERGWRVGGRGHRLPWPYNQRCERS